MNKLFTKIAGLALGFAMAIGVGAAVANADKMAFQAEADSSIAGYDPVSSLSAGDVVYFTYVAGSKVQVLTSVTSGTMGNVTELSGTTMNATYPLTVGKSGDNYTFKDKDNKYIAFTSTSTSSNNKLWLVNSATANGATWTVSFSGTTATIRNVYNSGRTLRGNTTSGQYRICGYATNTGTLLTLYKQAKTLSSISLGGTYDTEFTVGDTFNHTGMTVTATYSDSTTVDKTSSATWSSPDMSTAGQKTVTVSYTEGGTTKTADYSITVSAPVTPYITPAKNSTSGYTGQNESLSFAYGNLTGSLSVTSSNTSVVTVGTPSTSVGSGSVQINFVGAGSTTVKFKDGSTELASVSVSVTASSVTITGLPASKDVYVGKTVDLGSLISVTAIGSYSNAVTWESDDDGIATVTAAGVVSGVSEGDVDITVTSDDYPSATMTCTVSVSEAPLEDVLTSSVIPDAAVGSSTSSWGTASTFSDYTGAVYTARFMGVSSSSFIGRLNDSTNGYIYTSTVPTNMKLVSVSISSMTASKTVGVYAQTGAYTAAPSDKSSALGTITPSSLTYTFASNTNYNAICLRGHTSATEIGTVTITYQALTVLNSVTSSGQTTSFTAGNKWSYGGTLTAHYTGGKADATVTPASFKFGASGIDPTTSGTAIDTNVTLNHDDHNGKYIYVIYTEDEITKWASYQITVNYAAVTSVVIDVHTAGIGLNETYNHNLVGVTVNTQYAQQGYEWVVSANTVGDDYAFDESGLLSGDTEGTITLRCRSTADNSKYDELVVTVTGDPIADFTSDSVSGYVDHSKDIAFTYENMDDESLIEITSNNTSYVTIGDVVADEGEGLVTVNFVGAGSTTISISYDGGSSLDTIDVTVSADGVKTVTWTAPTIKVYSGATLSSTSGWNVHYEMLSGDEGDLSSGFDIKLGGSTITLPYAWDASDDGKALCVEYGGVQSSSTIVDVTQTLQAIMKTETSDWSHTITSKTWSAYGAKTINSKSWTAAVPNSDGAYFDYDSTKGQQFGKSADPCTVLTLSSSDFSGTIETIKVTTSGASSVTAKLSVTVGGSSFTNNGQNSVDISATSTEYTFVGSGTGEIVITWTNTSAKALYLKGLVVSTVSGSHDIANASGHEAAQKAVAKFAKAFNTALDKSNNCSNLGSDTAGVWKEATDAWTQFNTDISSLSSDEQTYAKNLIKYATAQWTKGTDTDYSYSLERAMATYEKCVKSYGMTAFMSAVRTVSSNARINSILSIGISNSNISSIIVILSMMSIAAVGGYFFLRKRKED